MPAFFLGNMQERAVIADAGFNIKAGAFNAIKITGNQGEFAACHTLCLSKIINKAGLRGDPRKTRPAVYFLWGRITGAALSSTPLTNLWLSSAPKVFASSIASLMATLYGTSSRLDSSNSAIRSTAFSTWPSSSSWRDR